MLRFDRVCSRFRVKNCDGSPAEGFSAGRRFCGSMDGPRATRRGVLALGGAFTFAGCSSVTGEIRRRLDPYTHNADAPLGETTDGWWIRGADERRTGATEDDPPGPESTVAPVVPASEHRPDQPVVDPERVYVGVDEVSVDGDPFSGTIAVDRSRTGSDPPYAWRNDGDGATVTAVRGSVVFESRNRNVYALDASDGSVYWRNAAGSTGALPDGETVYTSGERAIEALDAVTGEHRWSSELDLPALWPLAVAEEVDALLLAYGNGGEGRLYCVDRTDGTVRWRYDAVGESYAMAVTDGRRAFTVGTDGTLHAVDLENGEAIWTYTFRRESYERPAVADGTVYAVGTNDDELVALDASSGDQIWQVPLDVGVTPSPTVAGEYVLLQGNLEANENRLHVFDRRTGRLEYGFEYPTARVGSKLVQPVVVDGSAYVVGARPDADGSVLYEIR